MLRVAVLCLVLLGVVPMARANETVQQRIDKLLVGSVLIMPEGDGPHPVVIQMHGCGGRKQRANETALQMRWAEVARSAGWAVLVLDSYAHRGIGELQAFTTVCTGMQFWGRERAGDLYAAMAWVRGQGWADHSRIAVAGWSHGGWATLDAMALTPGPEMARETRLTDLPEDPLAGLVGAFCVYPYAGFGSLARERGLIRDIPVTALVGTKDQVVGGNSLAQALTRMPKPGAAIAITMMEGATHAFDEEGVSDPRLRYSPELTTQAQGIYTAFLREMAGR